MSTKPYAIHAAHIEADGLRLGLKPRARARTLAEALRLAGQPQHQGDDGAAIVCPDGRIIYSDEEYRAAEGETR